MALTFNDLVQLINNSVVENTTQDITATVMNDVLRRLLEFANEHDIADDRISGNFAKVTYVSNSITAATEDLENALKGPGPLPANADTLTDLYNMILSLSGSTPPAPVPTGVICMWSGDGTVLPSGWALCDGTNGTPDLRGRFVVGYHPGASDYDQPGNLSVLKYTGSGGSAITGETGGVPAHTLSKSNIPRHHHQAKGDGATIEIVSSGSHSHSTDAAKYSLKYVGKNVGTGEIANNAVSGATTYSSAHPHGNPYFSGKVGNGATDGLPASPQSIDHRPPYYVLAYIMKL